MPRIPLHKKHEPAQRPKFQHDEHSSPLTVPIQTDLSVDPVEGMDAGPCALFVLDEDVSNEMINGLMETLDDDVSSQHQYWLAESTFENLQDEDGESGTAPPLPDDWRSPFIGKSVEDAFRFLQTIPEEYNVQPAYLVVLNKHWYETKGWVLLYHVDEEGVISCHPWAADNFVTYLAVIHEHRWNLDLEDWRKGEWS